MSMDSGSSSAAVRDTGPLISTQPAVRPTPRQSAGAEERPQAIQAPAREQIGSARLTLSGEGFNRLGAEARAERTRISEGVTTAAQDDARIRDADFAFETARLAANQIRQQGGVAVLAQANGLNQNALRLLG